MERIPRLIESQVRAYLKPNKVAVVLGPRRVGKTVLLKKLLTESSEPYMFSNGEDVESKILFERNSVAAFKSILEGKKLLVIDEAQKIPDIGKALKLMVDEIEGLKVIISGSSAFDIENKTGEPLTGRKMTFKLFGISEGELVDREKITESKDALNDRLIYGSYPELFQMDSRKEKQQYLKELVNSYLLKDILTFETIRNSNKILDLLRLIAFQVGSEVSIPELSKTLQVSRNTVDKYLDLLTKVFIIYRVSGFSRNLRKEVSKSAKYYFLDNGIRNVLVGNLSPLNLRNDMGILWENYLVAERLKTQSYNDMLVYNFFWRTYDQQEIDWVEDRGGVLHAYEFKWNAGKKLRVPAGWKKTYPDSKSYVINPENYKDWLLNS
jgi:predicted AAA+ superfamily ATPase